MSALGPRANGLRTIRIVLAAIGIGMVALTWATVLLWFSNDARVQQINDERARNVVRSCEETNQRHDATIRQLRDLVASIPDPARRDRAEQGMASTVALIDALAPKRDCGALVAQQVDTR